MDGLQKNCANDLNSGGSMDNSRWLNCVIILSCVG